MNAQHTTSAAPARRTPDRSAHQRATSRAALATTTTWAGAARWGLRAPWAAVGHWWAAGRPNKAHRIRAAARAVTLGIFFGGFLATSETYLAGFDLNALTRSIGIPAWAALATWQAARGGGVRAHTVGVAAAALSAAPAGYLAASFGYLPPVAAWILTAVILRSTRPAPTITPPEPAPNRTWPVMATEMPAELAVAAGTVVWAEVDLDAPDEEGRTSKVRPMIIWGEHAEPSPKPGHRIYRGHKALYCTSKVDKYGDRDGWLVISGDYDAKGARSAVRVDRFSILTPDRIRKVAGHLDSDTHRRVTLELTKHGLR